MLKQEQVIAAGLTNVGTEDWGRIASAVPMATYALCCGLSHTRVSVDNCPRCKSALFWRRESKVMADMRTEKYFSQYQKLQDEIAQKYKEREERPSKRLETYYFNRRARGSEKKVS